MQDENIPKIIPDNKNITLRSHFSFLSVKKKMHTKIYFKTHKLTENCKGGKIKISPFTILPMSVHLINTGTSTNVKFVISHAFMNMKQNFYNGGKYLSGNTSY